MIIIDDKITNVSPVIILGMHRSGTSVIAQMLEELGLFIGHKKDSNWEAKLFVDINDWLLAQVSATWDRPCKLDSVMSESVFKQQIVSHVRMWLKAPRAASYTGWMRFFKGVDGYAKRWGWKDPRSTFTLPVWLEIFPNARVIHVVRHGVPVAASLVTRRNKMIASLSQNNGMQRSWQSVLRPARTTWRYHIACPDLDYALKLWNEYVSVAQQHEESLGERAMRVHYEDLCKNPHGVMNRLAGFCSLDVTPADCDKVTELVSRDRSEAWKQDADLVALARREAEMLAQFGY